MRKFLFVKANYLLKDIEIIGETDHSIRLRIGNFETEFKYKNHQLISWCSCPQGAVCKMCSHIIAGFAYLTKVTQDERRT